MPALLALHAAADLTPLKAGSRWPVQHAALRRLPTMSPRTALLLLIACLGGCAFGGLKHDADEFYRSSVLVGRVGGPAGDTAPVVVLALPAAGGVPVHQVMLHERGGYELIVPRGSYRVLAYADSNGNGRHDAGEPAGEATPGRAVDAPGQGVVAMLDIALSAAAAQALAPALAALPAAPRQSTQAGALVDLDAPALAAETGLRGYWAPVAFFRSQGGNILFLEPYDPVRTPVLFVHGAAGSAQDWRQAIARLDRSRYQAWLFVYPSGASVDSMAYLLYWKLLGLQLRHGFAQLHLVAHSMGGLVARSFLVDHGASFPQIRLFVSISTPWGGDSSADLGVKYAPAAVPSWHDMQPGGRFMQDLFSRRLPPGVEHDLLFGHRGGPSLLRPSNNDGTVTLASQLRAPAQDEATRVFGFDEDHVGILASARALAQLQALLDHADSRGASPTAGELALTLQFDTPGLLPQGLPILVLRPLDGNQAAMTVAVPGDSQGRRVGPLPAGRFEASVVVPGFVAAPRRQSVQVGGGSLQALAFTLQPQGMFSGYVGAELPAGDRPAGSLHPPHADPRITLITLQGAGILRRLVPRADDAALTLKRHLDGEDDAYGAFFSFVGLPDGEYTLTVRADGREDHVSQHTVLAGRPPPWQPLLLQRRR